MSVGPLCSEDPMIFRAFCFLKRFELSRAQDTSAVGSTLVCREEG